MAWPGSPLDGTVAVQPGQPELIHGDPPQPGRQPLGDPARWRRRVLADQPRRRIGIRRRRHRRSRASPVGPTATSGPRPGDKVIKLAAADPAGSPLMQRPAFWAPADPPPALTATCQVADWRQPDRACLQPGVGTAFPTGGSPPKCGRRCGSQVCPTPPAATTRPSGGSGTRLMQTTDTPVSRPVQRRVRRRQTYAGSRSSRPTSSTG